MRHGLGVGQAREGRREVEAEHVLPQPGHQILEHVLHVLLDDEAHLDVDLGELGLAILAQVLVAEAADDLEVAIEARHHEELLEELRRLGQGVELARGKARRHQEVARAAGRVLDQEGRFDLQELVLRSARAARSGRSASAGGSSSAATAGADRGRGT